MAKKNSNGQVSVAASLRQVFNQLIRLLEIEETEDLLSDPNAMERSLESWRRSIGGLTAGVSAKRARELENDKLQFMAKAAKLQKEADDLTARNKDLRDQIVRLGKRETANKQDLLKAQLVSSDSVRDAKALDLEVRQLRRRIRELEGGPPLSAAEAAPQSLKAVKKAEQEAAVEVEEERQLSLADAIAKHKGGKKKGSQARSAAEEAFSAIWKSEDDNVIDFDKAARKKRSAKGRKLVSLDDERKKRGLKSSKKKTTKKAAKKTSSKSSKTTAKKSATKKAPVSKKKVVSKKAATKKSTAKKAPAKKATTKKVVKKSAPTKKKAVSQKATAKKSKTTKKAITKATKKKAKKSATKKR